MLERAFFHFCRGDFITCDGRALTLFVQAKGLVHKRNKYALDNDVKLCKKKNRYSYSLPFIRERERTTVLL